MFPITLHSTIEFIYDNRISGFPGYDPQKVDTETATAIVHSSFPYLLQLSARKRLFTWLNYPDGRKGKGEDPNITVVLEQEKKVESIGLVIAAHALDSPEHYLFQVLAANTRLINSRPFPLKRGQYRLVLHEEDGATLFKLENGRQTEVTTA